jgi:hypothetical protein
MDTETYNLDNLNASQFRELLKNPRFYDTVTKPDKYGNLTTVVQDASIFAGFKKAEKKKFKKCLGVRRDERSSFHNTEGIGCCSPFARGYLAHKPKMGEHDCGYGFTGVPSDMEPEEKIITLPSLVQAMADVQIAETPEQIEERLQRERLETQQRDLQEIEQRERRRIETEQRIERELQEEAARKESELSETKPLITISETEEERAARMQREAELIAKRQREAAKKKEKRKAKAAAAAQAAATIRGQEEEQRQIEARRAKEIEDARAAEIEKGRKSTAKAIFETETIKNIVRNALKKQVDLHIFDVYYNELQRLHIPTIILGDDVDKQSIIDNIKEKIDLGYDRRIYEDLIKIILYIYSHKQELEIPLEYQPLYDEDVITITSEEEPPNVFNYIANAIGSNKANKIRENPQLFQRYKNKIKQANDYIQDVIQKGKTSINLINAMDTVFSDKNIDIIAIRKAYGIRDKKKSKETVNKLLEDFNDMQTVIENFFIVANLELQSQASQITSRQINQSTVSSMQSRFNQRLSELAEQDTLSSRVADLNHDKKLKARNLKIMREAIGQDKTLGLMRGEYLDYFNKIINAYDDQMKKGNENGLKEKIIGSLMKGINPPSPEILENLEMIFDYLSREDKINILKNALGEDELAKIKEDKNSYSYYYGSVTNFREMKNFFRKSLDEIYQLVVEWYTPTRHDPNFVSNSMKIARYIYEHDDPDAAPRQDEGGASALTGGKTRKYKYRKYKTKKHRKLIKTRKNKNKKGKRNTRHIKK